MSATRNAPGKAPRAMRADAQRNRNAILAAARETFEEERVLASLDGIAVRAGIGNATLYRNFPTRDDLLAAVMEANVDGRPDLKGGQTRRFSRIVTTAMSTTTP
jgi:AcrR family transcriptional regulator